MRVCTNDQMRKLDSLTIQKYNVSGEILMERAGRWVASVALDIMEKSKSNTVCIVAGRGNNGGDGFVVARYLSQIGFDVQIILCAEPDDITGDASLNFEKVKQEKINWKKFDGNIPKTDLIVDALLGTGISGAPRSPLNKAINIINEHHNNGAFVLAVDIPSGVNGDNGEVAGDAVYADCTITFGFPKLGHFFHPGKKHTGMLYIADIGLDSRAISEVSADYEFASIQTINELLPYRPPDGHKGTFGKGLIVACSAGMTGAGIMAGISFLRSGAGLCYLAVPRSLTDIVDSSATEVVVLPMPEVRRKRCHTLRALGELHKYAQNVDAIAIGPGLGTHFETPLDFHLFISQSSSHFCSQYPDTIGMSSHIWVFLLDSACQYLHSIHMDFSQVRQCSSQFTSPFANLLFQITLIANIFLLKSNIAKDDISILHCAMDGYQ